MGQNAEGSEGMPQSTYVGNDVNKKLYQTFYLNYLFKLFLN